MLGLVVTEEQMSIILNLAVYVQNFELGNGRHWFDSPVRGILSIYGNDGSKRLLKIQLVKSNRVQGFYGTYEFGELVKDSIAMSIESIEKDPLTNSYDPSMEF